MRFKARWVCFIIAALFVISCGKKSEDQSAEPTPKTVTSTKKLDSKPAFTGDKVVATWDNGKIYLSQIDKLLYNRFSVVQRLDALSGLTKDHLAAERRAILDKLIDNYMMMLESDKEGIALSASDKELLIKQLRGMFNSEEEYQQNLKESGQSESEYINVLGSMKRIELCLRQKEQELRDAITPDDLRKYYDENLSKFTPPHRTQFNEVVIRANKGRSLEQAKQLAEKLHAEVKTKMDAASDLKEKRKAIQDCAYNYSDGENGKYNYGYTILYLDAQAQAIYDKTFLDALKSQPVSTLSDVVRNKNEYVFFWVTEQLPSVSQKFESPSVQKTIPNLIVEKEMKEWKTSLRDAYHCRILDENLSNSAYCGPVIDASATDEIGAASTTTG